MQHPEKYFTTRELSKVIDANITSISRCCTLLVKRNDFMFKYSLEPRSIRKIGYKPKWNRKN